MPPRSEVWATDFGIDITMLHITAQDLNDNPEYAIGILNYAFREHLRRIKRLEAVDSLREMSYRKLEFCWIFGEQFGSRAARAPVEEVIDGYIHREPGSRGRPVTPMRHAAIKAFIRKLYLKKPWLEITRRVCPCGNSHRDPNKVVAQCQPKLETQVRFLKRLLKDCDIQISGELPAKAIMQY